MEFRLIDRIHARTAQAREDVRLGIGDDAALLAVPDGQELAVALDTLVEGVHFPAGTAPADIGWKALAVNLSDLAAMGAAPAWALLGLTLPVLPAEALAARVDGLADGFAQLAQAYGVALVGGDTTRGPFALSVAVHGFVPPGQALRRDGAQVGDAVFVTGTLGDAAAALQLLAAAADPAEEARRAILRARLHRPQPRVAAGLALRRQATACIDVSDGLLADLSHLCAASGVAAELEVTRLPLSPALRGVVDHAQACRYALGGGDDYELCFTVPAAQAEAVQADLLRLGCGATRIGQIVAGAGVRARAADGTWLSTDRAGWDHFAGATAHSEEAPASP
ncbi:thiamine-phosphate kinase [Dyella sp.]|jgi:thiamine-monophosphate kinase|uniref:thiamine-phosphate kinase n=1 Tax=Dyella sp. TaxID=1869338 RepID=UPI002D790878|nr:thiamine-phosphate kinase [Dyella sp.]HET6433276.1 thiamine-phosphate kinase [Dyella sp.]